MRTRGFVRHVIFPLLTAMIWGSAFVFQSTAADHMGPFTFNFCRGAVGCVSLLAVVIPRLAAGKRSGRPMDRRGILVGVLCGAAIAAASNLQQVGISISGAGKSGFVTSLYIVLVPVLGLLLGKKTGGVVWVSVAAAVAGLYLLCVKGDFGVSLGDAVLLGCALLFALHIILVDRFAADMDGFELSCLQFAVMAAISAVGMFLFEKPSLSDIRPGLGSILYVGVVSSAVAYTLQILAQQGGDPARVSLLFSLEAVFAALAGAVFLHERMSAREYAGCALMLIAVALPQVVSIVKSKEHTH